MDAHGAKDPRLRGHDRRSDRVDQALDRQAGILPTERRREQTLYRAALHRRKLWLAGAIAWPAGGRARVFRGTRSRSEHPGQHEFCIEGGTRGPVAAVTRFNTVGPEVLADPARARSRFIRFEVSPPERQTPDLLAACDQ